MASHLCRNPIIHRPHVEDFRFRQMAAVAADLAPTSGCRPWARVACQRGVYGGRSTTAGAEVS